MSKWRPSNPRTRQLPRSCLFQPRANGTEQQEEHGGNHQAFLNWLVANGVQGLGKDDSKVGLYQSDNDRGITCIQVKL